MAFAVPLAERFGRIPRVAWRLLATLLLAAGLLVAWQAFLARGSACASGPTPEGTCLEWEAWYRWPGVAAGIVLVMAAAAMFTALQRQAGLGQRARKGKRDR